MDVNELQTVMSTAKSLAAKHKVTVTLPNYVIELTRLLQQRLSLPSFSATIEHVLKQAALDEQLRIDFEDLQQQKEHK